MIAHTDRLFMSAENYLLWEAQQPYKYEYADGEAYAMTGGTLPHNAVAVNLISLLRAHLRGTGCRAFMNDVKVQAKKHSAYFYPDIVVTCDPRDLKARQLVRHPCLIIEVLSPSTEGYDRGKKFQHYRKLASLKEYVLVNAETMGLDCYRLNDQGKWELNAYHLPEEALPEALLESPPGAARPAAVQIEFSSIGFTCPIDLVYEEVDLGPIALEADETDAEVAEDAF